MAKPKALNSDWMTVKSFCRHYHIRYNWIKKAYAWGLLRADRDVTFDLEWVNVPAVMKKEPEIVLLESIVSKARQRRLAARPFVRGSSEDKRRMAEKILKLRREIEQLRVQLIGLVQAEYSASKAYWNILWEPPDCPWCHGEQKGKDGKKCTYCKEAS